MACLLKPVILWPFNIAGITAPKFSAFQKNKLDHWLRSEGEIKESKPALESEPTFSINLSNLISIFLDKKNDNKLYTYKSAPFTIQSLRKNENITQ